MNNLEKLFFAKYKFNIEFESYPELPAFTGSLIRGTFGHALKNTVCMNDIDKCENCYLIKTCPFPYLFKFNEYLVKKNATNPQIIGIGKPKGKKMSFYITLIGKGLDFLPQVIFSVNEMGKLGFGKDNYKFFLNSVEFIDAKYNAQIILSAQNTNMIPHKPQNINDFDIKLSDQINITTISPMQILDKNRELITELNFNDFIKTTIMRISTLMYYHTENKLDIDFSSFFEKSKSIKTLLENLVIFKTKRYSITKNSEKPIEGIKFDAKFFGDLNEFLPFIYLGSYLHTGKLTSLGLGEYKISVV